VSFGPIVLRWGCMIRDLADVYVYGPIISDLLASDTQTSPL
jgi:hypothetical protein